MTDANLSSRSIDREPGMTGDYDTTRMLGIEVKGELQKIGMCVQVLAGVNVNGLLREYSLNDAVGWAIDPTGYRDNMRNLQANERVVRALGIFLKECREAWPAIFEGASS